MYIYPYAFDMDRREVFAFYENALTSEECDRIINNCVGEMKEAGTLDVNLALKIDKKYRDSKTNFVGPEKLNETADKIASIILNLNSNFFGFDLWGFAEGFQYTEYHAPSGKYDPHVDCMYMGMIRKLSVVIQLSDPSEYEGGDLNLIVSKNKITMKKQKGLLIAFPSFVLHEVTRVTRGTRRTLVSWATGTQFK